MLFYLNRPPEAYFGKDLAAGWERAGHLGYNQWSKGEEGIAPRDSGNAGTGPGVDGRNRGTSLIHAAGSSHYGACRKCMVPLSYGSSRYSSPPRTKNVETRCRSLMNSPSRESVGQAIRVDSSGPNESFPSEMS